MCLFSRLKNACRIRNSIVRSDLSLKPFSGRLEMNFRILKAEKVSA